MSRLVTASIIAACVVVSGCAASVKVARFDQVTRTPKVGDLDVFTSPQAVARPYKEIALFTVDGEGREEADAVQGFIDLARKCGADAVLVDRAATFKKEGGGKIVDTETKEGIQGGGSETIFYPNARCVFRATAIVWTEH